MAINKEISTSDSIKKFIESNNQLQTKITIENSRALGLALRKYDLWVRNLHKQILHDTYMNKHEVDFIPVLAEMKLFNNLKLFILEPKTQSIFGEYTLPKIIVKKIPKFNDPKYWNDFYESNTDSLNWYCDSDKLLSVLIPYLKKSDKILQIGCGNSSTICQYKHRFTTEIT